MKIVVGLGNPGQKYTGTRHNIGFEVLAECGRRWGVGKPKNKFEAEVLDAAIGAEKVLLVAPQTFMNLSGRSVQQFVRFHQLSLNELIVVCDDLNLKVGQIRLRPSGSAGGQKGLANILVCQSSDQIPRLRLGIGRPPPPMDSVDYVLGRFQKDEIEKVDESVRRASEAIEVWITQGISAAMNQFNGEILPKGE